MAFRWERGKAHLHSAEVDAWVDLKRDNKSDYSIRKEETHDHVALEVGKDAEGPSAFRNWASERCGVQRSAHDSSRAHIEEDGLTLDPIVSAKMSFSGRRPANCTPSAKAMSA